MQRALVTGGFVFLATISVVVGSACYTCSYAKTGSSEVGKTCASPDVDESFSGNCGGMCAKDVYSADNVKVVFRSCQLSCKEGDYSLLGYGSGTRHCCDPSETNKCNGSERLRAGASLAAVAIVMVVKAFF